MLDNRAEIKLAMDGDIWLQQEYNHVENLYYRSIDEIINEWVYGPDQQEEHFKNLLSTRSGLLPAIIRIIKKRKYRSKPRISNKKMRTFILRNEKYWDSPWGQMLKDPSTKIPGSYLYKRFRRRFRIPFELFQPLIDECELHNIFSSVSDLEETGRTKQIPTIKFKVLSALRMLSRDYYADDVAEILNCGEETARQFQGCFN